MFAAKVAKAKICFWFISLLAFTFSNTYAEGTKQLRPTISDFGNIVINTGTNVTSAFANYGCDYSSRLHLTIKDTAERVYMGFQASREDMYMRIVDPAGKIVYGPIKLPKPPSGFSFDYPGWCQNYFQTIEGPRNFRNDNKGFVPIVFNPDTIGDFYIEFNPFDPNTPALSATQTDIYLFDITVAKDQQIMPGRLWSLRWNLSTLGFGNPLNAKMYVYTTYGIVSELDFNGIKPYGFNVSCNPTGCTNTGNPLVDRKSRYGNHTYPKYKIFLTPPDSTVFPTGKMGFITAKTSVVGCLNKKYCIFVETNTDGLVESYINLNGVSGYQPGTEDVSLVQYLDSAGTHCISWDGLDGLGVPVQQGETFYVYSQFKFGITHLPLHDVEKNEFGYKVKAIRPLFPEQPTMYWDDSDILTGTALDAVTSLDGCNNVNGCHRWTGRGNNNNPETINTWWYANVTTDSAEFVFKEKIDVDISLDPVTITSKDTLVCYGDSVSFYPLSLVDTSKYLYEWYLDSTKVVGKLNQYTGWFTDTSNLFLKVTGLETGCSASDTIRIWPKEEIPVIISHSPNQLISNDTTLCFGTQYSLYGFEAGADTVNFKQQWHLPGQHAFGTGPTGSRVYTDTTTVILRVEKLADGCAARDTITLWVPHEIYSLDTLIHDWCQQGNGLIKVGAFGGSGNFTYKWSNDSTLNSPENPNLSAGDYHLMLFDSISGCMLEGNFTIKSLPEVGLDSLRVIDARCGADSGAVIFEPKGGMNVYDFYIDDTIAITKTNVMVAAGMHKLTIVDQFAGCIFDTVFNVSFFPHFTIDSLANRQSACDSTNGQLGVYVSGGTQPLTYSWSGFSGINLPVIGNVSDGDSLLLTITDTASGCQTDTLLGLPKWPHAQLTISNVYAARCDTNNGSIIASVTGGMGAYGFSWFNNDNLLTHDKKVSGLDSGTYQVVVYDSVAGCTDQKTVFLPRLNHFKVNAISIDPATCGLDNGAAGLFVTGGAGLITKTWQTNPVKTGNIVTNLPSGLVGVTITDQASGCVLDTSVFINRLNHFSIDSMVAIKPRCGLPNGEVQAYVSGGTGTLQYKWPNYLSQNNATLNNLPGGSYKVIVTDQATGCTDSASASMLPYEHFMIANIESKPARCDLNNGEINLNVIGGTGTLSYQWSQIPSETDKNVDNLTEGMYNIKITDQATGCSEDTVAQVNRLPHFTISQLSTKESAQCGDPNGEAIVATNGGTGVVTYQWQTNPTQSGNLATGLDSGWVGVTIIDQGSMCQVDTQVFVQSLPHFVLDSVSTKRPTCGQPNGRISVYITDGVSISYNWHGPIPIGNQAQAQSLPGGNYKVVINDAASGCSDSAFLSLSAVPHFTIDSINIVPAKCGLNNAKTTVSTSGSLHLLYGFNNLAYQVSSTINKLNPGVLSINVKDTLTQCTEDTSITVEALPHYTLNGFTVDSASCGLPNGSIIILASGGSGTLFTGLEGTQLHPGIQVRNLAQGVYNVVVTDTASLCADTLKSIVVAKVDTTQIEFATQPEVCNKSNGVASAILSGGSGNFAYQWSNWATSATINGLPSGSYWVKVTDKHFGCVDSQWVSINSKQPYAWQTIAVNPTCYQPNGAIKVVNVYDSLSMPVFSLEGQPNLTDTLFRNLGAGNYTVIAFDSVYGCQTKQTVSLINLTENPQANIVTTPGSQMQWFVEDSIVFANRYYNWDKYEWRIGQNEPNTYTTETFTLPVGSTDDIIVRLRVTDKYGCVDSAVFSYDAVKMLPGIPNIITPNGDGFNDQLVIPIPWRIARGTYTVLNRWNEVIFTAPTHQSWSPGNLPTGTYYLVIDFDNRTDYKGWLQIMR